MNTLQEPTAFPTETDHEQPKNYGDERSSSSFVDVCCFEKEPSSHNDNLLTESVLITYIHIFLFEYIIWVLPIPLF